MTRNQENGHFTQVARDVSFKVGCSISQYIKEGGWYTTYYVCNYAVTNIVGGQIYEEGPMASKCKTGTNPKYPALCSESEDYSDSDYINWSNTTGCTKASVYRKIALILGDWEKTVNVLPF